MSALPTPKPLELPRVHASLALGFLIGGLVAGGVFIPVLLTWPFYLLAPLTAYVLVAVIVAPLRRTLSWVRLGRIDRGAWIAAAVVVLLSSLTLVIWSELAQPDVSVIVAALPQGSLAMLLLAGLVFSCVNALLEEILFRGLLFDALCVSYGVVVALAIQAAAFGVFHMHGFPSGTIGVVLATMYGLLQGALRVYTGGLAACWVAHCAADATIFVLLLRHAA